MADLEVVVAGGGNAALCAAITAREKGAAVTLFESAPEICAVATPDTQGTCARATLSL